jgi:hypothetical protein
MCNTALARAVHYTFFVLVGHPWSSLKLCYRIMVMLRAFVLAFTFLFWSWECTVLALHMSCAPSWSHGRAANAATAFRWRLRQQVVYIARVPGRNDAMVFGTPYHHMIRVTQVSKPQGLLRLN